MLKILVSFALRQEGVSFERRLTQRSTKFGSVLGRLHAQEVAVYWLGIGVRDEDRFKRTLEDLRPELVINSGFAGAVRTLLEPGDFVLAENFTSPELLKRLETVRLLRRGGGSFASRRLPTSLRKRGSTRRETSSPSIWSPLESLRFAENLLCR